MKEFYVFESYPGKKYLPVEEMQTATYDDLDDAGYSREEIGIEVVAIDEENCEIENHGYEIFKSLTGDFEGFKTWEEIKDIETDLGCVRYWDGNNWKIYIFDEFDFIRAEVIENDPPSPAYFFTYDLVTEAGKRITVSKSNMSGSISPFYEEMVQEEEY